MDLDLNLLDDRLPLDCIILLLPASTLYYILLSMRHDGVGVRQSTPWTMMSMRLRQNVLFHTPMSSPCNTHSTLVGFGIAA